MANENNKVITLMCERSADVNDLLDADGKVKGVDGLHVVKLPCSGMVQPNMIETALKSGAAGVVVCGCQIGDCYYREGNKMIRERLLGNRVPTLKKATDRRRILALWLSRPQKDRFLADTAEFVRFVGSLPDPEPAAAPAKPAAAAAAKGADTKASEKAGETKAETAQAKAAAVPEKTEAKVVDDKAKAEVEVAPIQENKGPIEDTSGEAKE